MMKNRTRISFLAALALGVSTAMGAQDIDVASLNMTPSSGTASALAGVCPWLNVTADSGLPYASSRITLRGELSENGTLPLILVDGVEIPLEVLDPADIESIEVLKDGAAALYGARAAAGAIIIRTKNAGSLSADSQSVSVNAFTGVTAGGADGMDWKCGAFNGARLTQNYKVSARGGNDAFSYYAGGHYFGEDGLFDKAFGKGGYSNVGFVGNFNARINKWLRYNVGFDYTYRQSDSPFWGGDRALFNALASDLSTPCLEAAASPYSYDLLNSHFVMMKNALSAAIINGLELEVSYAFSNLYDFHTSRCSEVEGVDAAYAPNFFSEIRDRSTDNDLDCHLSYDTILSGLHHVSAVAGMDMQFGNYKHVPARVGNLIDPTISAITVGDGNFSVDERKGRFIQTGIFARASYSYADRYSAELTARADGTSRLPEKNRWAPSVALSIGWTISNEHFMDDSGVDLLKLRYTFGTVADQRIPGCYSYIPSIDPRKDKSPFLFDRTAGLQYYSGLNYAVYANLASERVMSHDLGVDAAFLGSRLSFTGDVFYRRVSNMLTSRPAISAVSGDVPQCMNYGEASTTGFELSLGWADTIGESDFSYSVKGMFADHLTTLSSIADPRLSYALTGSLKWNGLELSLLFDGAGKYEWPFGEETLNASYFCLRDVRMGYTLPFRTDAAVKSLRFGISGRNLFTAGPALPADFLLSTGGTGSRLPLTALLNVGINF